MRRTINTVHHVRRFIVPTTALLMTCMLSACDLPGIAKTSDDGVAVSASAKDSAALPAKSAAQTKTKAAPVAAGKVSEPAADDEDPPIPADIVLTPMEKSGHPEGNAELSIRYENSETLGDAVAFEVDKRKYLLKRDGGDSKRFSAMIDFDFDTFQEEQQLRKRMAAEAKASDFPVFKGREFVGQEKFQFIEPEQLRLARDRSLALQIDPGVITVPPPGVILDPANTLMITDISVIEDPTRTFDICGNVGDPDGAWTFKTLMTNMANPNDTGVDPADFVEDWLQSWNVNHTINTFSVPARTRMNTRVLNAWPRDANGRLDLNQSPMRLLAIVNRMDLRRTATQSTTYGGGGNIPLDAGEGRFVFGVVDRSVNGGCSKMDFTVILEYRVPITQCTSIRNYAQQWQGLNGLTLGSAAFNPALQAVTDQFTAAGAGGTKPNGSAISQIRTNEIALARGYRNDPSLEIAAGLRSQITAVPFSAPWELREFHLQSDNMLHIVSTQNTPHHTWNNTPLLASFINSTATTVPVNYLGQSFLTGSTLNFSVADSAVWNAPGAINQERHLFSLNTCNACHGGEVRDNATNFDTAFVHITPRDAGGVSDLSKFLLGNSMNLSAPSTFAKADPIFGTPTRPFGDLLRRQNLLPQLAFGSCNASGLLLEAALRPMLAVH